MSIVWESDGGGASVRVVQGSSATHAESVANLVRLFSEVATREGWQPGDALDAWRDQSEYFAVEIDGKLAGGLQLVLPDRRGLLPCHGLWPELPPVAREERKAHVAILALGEEYRGDSAYFWYLGTELWRYCVARQIRELLLEATPRVLPLYQRLGWPLEIRGALKMHWGEDCYLCALGVAEVARALVCRAEHSDLYRQIVARAFRLDGNASGIATAASVFP